MARPNLNLTDTPPLAADQRLLAALGVPFARAAETSTTGFALLDAEGIVRWASASFSRLTRVTGALLGAPLADRLDERFRMTSGEARRTFSEPGATTLELIEGRDGAPVLLHVAALDGDQRIVVAVAADAARVGGAVGAVDEILIDPVTRLGNRHLLEQTLAGATDADQVHALIVVGLDGFTMHESLGRVACDQLLALVGDRLRRACRSEETVVRLQGDTFAILHDSTTGHDSVARIAMRLAASLDEPIALQDKHVALEASVGIATDGRATTTRADLLEHALAALAAAKRAGGRTWREFQPDLLDD